MAMMSPCVTPDILGLNCWQDFRCVDKSSIIDLWPFDATQLAIAQLVERWTVA